MSIVDSKVNAIITAMLIGALGGHAGDQILGGGLAGGIGSSIAGG